MVWVELKLNWVTGCRCPSSAKAAWNSKGDARGGRSSHMRNRRRGPDWRFGEFAGAGEQLGRYEYVELSDFGQTFRSFNCLCCCSVFLGRRGELHDDPERPQLLHTSERRRRQRCVSGSLQEGRAGLQEHGGNRGVRSSSTPRYVPSRMFAAIMWLASMAMIVAAALDFLVLDVCSVRLGANITAELAMMTTAVQLPCPI